VFDLEYPSCQGFRELEELVRLDVSMAWKDGDNQS